MWTDNNGSEGAPRDRPQRRLIAHYVDPCFECAARTKVRHPCDGLEGVEACEWAVDHQNIDHSLDTFHCHRVELAVAGETMV